jgi:uncharacterized protein (TIGR02266 family)
MSQEHGRRAARVELDVEITMTSEHTFWSGFTSNVSTGGVFVATDRLLPLGSRVSFELALPPSDRGWQLTGEVRWLREKALSDDIPAGLGLQFVDLPDDAAEAIKEFILTKRDSLFFDDED